MSHVLACTYKELINTDFVQCLLFLIVDSTFIKWHLDTRRNTFVCHRREIGLPAINLSFALNGLYWCYRSQWGNNRPNKNNVEKWKRRVARQPVSNLGSPNHSAINTITTRKQIVNSPGASSHPFLQIAKKTTRVTLNRNSNYVAVATTSHSRGRHTIMQRKELLLYSPSFHRIRDFIFQVSG